MSSISIIFVLVSEYFWWTQDWWHPLTITSTRIGIEDIIAGWSNGGVVAVIYEVVLKKRLQKPSNVNKRFLIYGLVIGCEVIIFSGIMFWLLHFTSFISCLISYLIGIILMVSLRKNLLTNAILSGLLMVLITLPVFIIVESLFPGSINSMWYSQNLSGVKFIVAPLEDIIFYFLLGAWVGPLYKFMFDYRSIANTLKEKSSNFVH